MSNYSIKRTTKYPGGHPLDPGYRVTRIVADDGHEFVVHSRPDGSNISRIASWSERTGHLTALSMANRRKRSPDIEVSIKAWIDVSSDKEI